MEISQKKEDQRACLCGTTLTNAHCSQAYFYDMQTQLSAKKVFAFLTFPFYTKSTSILVIKH